MNTPGIIKRYATKVLIHIFLIICAVFSIYPIIWIVMSSLNPGNALYSSTLIPKNITISHYVELFTETDFGLWYMNTLKIAFFTMVLSVVFVVITAYALSQFRFRGRKLTLMTMLVLQAFPSFMSMIAVYLLLLQIGMLDTHLGLIIVYTAGAIPYGAWLVKGYFDSIPRSLPEAAKIDGATNMKVFVKVMMPLSTPIITFIALTNFMAPWMDFILARLVLRTASKKTLAIGLFEMVRDRANTEFTMFAAGAVMVAIPITVLFVILQRYVIQGIAEGACKT
ncbi:MAG: sugar ABC transporter permease [Clostridiaceae bacterium]|nr:sugar ABC transporter permease [Clostridiaceae bacterium]